MTAAETHLAQLSEERRQILEAWLVEFDQTWDEGRLAYWVRKLPPPGDALRRPALLEMVKIDLERRWQRGHRVGLEAYVKALPELGALDNLPPDLIQAEYEVRQECGALADRVEFSQRFRRQAGELHPMTSEMPGPHYPADFLNPHPNGPVQASATLAEAFGRYRLVRKLGQGAMGTVYLAHDPQLDRPVALKIPQLTPEDDPEVRQRFLSEARAAATLEHPNICPVHDVGEVNGTPYLTMAYVEGNPLSQLLNGAARLLSPRQVATLVSKLALALQEAHERGVIHRDLKPSNIIINQRGEPVILDFGLARRMRPGDVRLTQSGQPLGTPAYMPPEQVAGAVRVMGPGCDIYSLGVILYQLLTGRLPFEGSMAEVLGQIITRQPEPPSKHRPDLDPHLEAACLKALSKEAADRYASMRDFATALAHCLHADNPPVVAVVPLGSAGPPPVTVPHGRTGKVWYRRKPVWLVAAGVAAAVLTGVVLWSGPAMGSVLIELDGPRARFEVQVDGERIDDAALTEPLRLPAGKHHLLITGTAIKTVSETFTVAAGANPPLRIRLLPEPGGQTDPSPRRSRSRDDDDDEAERRRERRERPLQKKRPPREREPDDD